jgi:hypothetical protein
VIWRDIVLDASASDGVIAQAVAEAFSVAPSGVRISDRIEDIAIDPVFCLRAPLPGATFNFQLSIYVAEGVEASEDTLTAISRALHRSLLTSNDESSDAYSMLLVQPDGRKQVVQVNPDEQDEKGAYQLEQPMLHSRPNSGSWKIR